jgi:hypothetical protein
MRRVRRKSGILRRLVLGLAVAAIVAPAAQARPYEGTATQGKAKDPVAVIRGDDKKIVTLDDSSGALINGDDKLIVPTGGVTATLIHDDKVIVPTGGVTATLIHDDKVIVPTGGVTATLIHDDKVIVPTGGVTAALIHDDKVIVPAPGTRAVVPVEAVRGPSSFDWGDALVGAGAAFGLMLLLGGAALGTRHVRPAAA